MEQQHVLTVVLLLLFLHLQLHEAAPVCTDKITFCKYFKTKCSVPSVSKNCAKTCNLCDPTTAPPVTYPTGTINPGGTCGKRVKTPTIVGGTDAQPGDWPWQVTFRYKDDKPASNHYCGGTLVSLRWVVTAAHCIKIGRTDVEVTLGEHDLSKTEGNEQKIKVIKMVNHPQYNDTTVDNDVALMKLMTPARYTQAVQPACLVDDTGFPAGTPCYITGWGTVQFGTQSYPDILQQAKVPLVAQSTCKAAYKPDYAVTDRMLCAGYARGSVDTCQGDSGGPLICEKNGVWQLTGITSWGIGCGDKGYYGVYADVRALKDWIIHAMNTE